MHELFSSYNKENSSAILLWSKSVSHFLGEICRMLHCIIHAATGRWWVKQYHHFPNHSSRHVGYKCITVCLLFKWWTARFERTAACIQLQSHWPCWWVLKRSWGSPEHLGWTNRGSICRSTDKRSAKRETVSHRVSTLPDTQIKAPKSFVSNFSILYQHIHDYISNNKS